jgi:hypothetical protein
MNVIQFRRFVIDPVLHTLDLHSPAAVALMLGTAIHESGGLSYLDQITGRGGAAADDELGPAIGFYQMEPATHDDLFENFLRFPKRKQLLDLVLQYRAPMPGKHKQLLNPIYATAVARAQYYRARPPLPAAGDWEGIAGYWKEHWNTPAGKGTTSEFLTNWHRFGGPAAIAAA